MPIGLSNGALYETEAAMAMNQPLDDKNAPDKLAMQPQDVINYRGSPTKEESDIGSGMPLGSSTEPTGAFNSSSGGQVAAGPSRVNIDTTDWGKKYNTPLNDDEYTSYGSKYGPYDNRDYDMQGFYKANPDVTPHTDGTHYPDTFKKPNHITFSDESQYNGVDGNNGGHWGVDAQGNDTFTPGSTNLQNYTFSEMQDYFKRNEPGAKLLEPQPASVGTPQGPDPAKGQSVVDKLLGLNGERYQTWPEKVIRGISEGILAPGNAAQGNTPMWAMDPETGEVHTSPEAVEGAGNLAQLAVLGPMPLAGKLADGTLGSFAGVTSKTIDKTKLYEAQNLEMNGLHHNDIWDQTGFFRGADNRWRYEIPDANAKLKDEAFNKIGGGQGSWTQAGGRDTISLSPNKIEAPSAWGGTVTHYVPKTLDQVLDHPELFKAYPDLAKIKVGSLPDFWKDKATGLYNETDNKISLGQLPPDEMRATLLHEISHAIQAREGFARGASEQSYLPPELPKAMEQFNKAKQVTEDSLKQERGLNDTQIKQLKLAVRLEGNLQGEAANVLNDLKEKHPQIYKNLKEITESERLIDEAKDKARKDYLRTAGEVEARNVERRMDYSYLQRFLNSPRTTESVNRKDQIIKESSATR